MQDQLIDSREFRNVMGRFATGVTVVTVRVGDQRRGMTANAVTSLSLHPPMLLVCVDRNATMHPLFEVADTFAVNILAADQKSMSDFFARHSDASAVLGGFPYRDGAFGAHHHDFGRDAAVRLAVRRLPRKIIADAAAAPFGHVLVLDRRAALVPASGVVSHGFSTITA